MKKVQAFTILCKIDKGASLEHWSIGGLMLDQFQVRYSTGSLISELLQIHQGKFVVRVSAQVEGVTRATGMAADETLEIAEDRARSRALMVLGIEPIVATQAESLPLQPTVNELPSKLTKTPQMPEVTSVPCSVTTRSLNSLSYAPATSQQVPAAESFLAPADSMGLSNERLPLTKSTQLPEALRARTLTVTASVPVSDTLTKSTQPPEATFEKTLTQDLESKPAMDSSQEELPFGNVMSINSRRPNRQDMPELEQSLPEPEDLSDVIAETNFELDRLGWSPEAGRDYLIRNYNKRSRKLLSPKELLEFLKYLKSQPTP